jgi:hypothetical protein
MLGVKRPADGNREPPAIIEFLPKEWAGKNWQLHPDNAYRSRCQRRRCSLCLAALPCRFASILAPHVNRCARVEAAEESSMDGVRLPPTTSGR